MKKRIPIDFAKEPQFRWTKNLRNHIIYFIYVIIFQTYSKNTFSIADTHSKVNFPSSEILKKLFLFFQKTQNIFIITELNL